MNHRGKLKEKKRIVVKVGRKEMEGYRFSCFQIFKTVFRPKNMEKFIPIQKERLSLEI